MPQDKSLYEFPPILKFFHDLHIFWC